MRSLSFWSRLRAGSDYFSETSSWQFEVTRSRIPTTPSLTTPGVRLTFTFAEDLPFKYWEDHADRHIKILEVHPAD